MNRFAIATLAAVAIGFGPRAAAQARADRITVPLSEPSRPATLDIHLAAGIVDVTGSDGREIVIEATSPPGSRRRVTRGPGNKLLILRRPSGTDTAGLTRLQQPTALDVEESNNVVAVRGPSDARVDLTIRVPVRTNLKLRKTARGSTPGAITVRGLDGDLEIHAEAGTVTLVDVSGSVVAHSTSGSIHANMRRVASDRPMAFTSYTGNVDVTLPRAVKADVIARSTRGDVFTDFDVQLKANDSGEGKQPGGGFKRSGNQPLQATVNGGGPEFELRTYAGNIFLRRGN